MSIVLRTFNKYIKITCIFAVDDKVFTLLSHADLASVLFYCIQFIRHSVFSQSTLMSHKNNMFQDHRKETKWKLN